MVSRSTVSRSTVPRSTVPRSTPTPTSTGLVLMGLVLAGATALAPRPALGSETVLVIYDVRDLLMVRQDFPAPKLGLSGLDEEGSSTVLVFGDEEEDEGPWLTGETLVELVRAVIAPGSWVPDGPNAIQYHRGRLIVHASVGAHASLDRDLARWRAAPTEIPRPTISVEVTPIALGGEAVGRLRKAADRSHGLAFVVDRAVGSKIVGAIPPAAATPVSTGRAYSVAESGALEALISKRATPKRAAPKEAAAKREIADATASRLIVRSWPARNGGRVFIWRESAGSAWKRVSLAADELLVVGTARRDSDAPRWWLLQSGEPRAAETLPDEKR